MNLQALTSLSPSDLMLIGTVLAVACAVFVFVRTLYPTEILGELRAKAQAQRDAGQPGAPPPGRLYAFGIALVRKIGGYNVALATPAFRARLQRRFVAMGRPDFRAEDFIAHQWIWGVLFGVLGLMLMNLLERPLWYALAFAAFGAVFPHIWLRDQILKRQRAILRAMPYHTDLLTLSVEAGLDFQAALGTVVEKGRPGPLIEELNLTLGEIRLGKTRAEALRNLAERVQVADVSAFVANVVQADKMGTSLGKVLRIQTTQMRINRTHRAEKLANEAPVKMLLPLIGCIFPTVFFILFGPIVYRLVSGGGW